MIEIRNLFKNYFSETVLKDVNLTLPDKGLFIIYGKSGCGKSTLLNIIGQLDTDYQGAVLYNGDEIREIKNYRGNIVSFVFQDFYLFSWLKTKDNIWFSRFFKKIGSKNRGNSLIKKLQLNKLLKLPTSKLSGGQKQRVAIGRSIVGNNPIILCDEPTGSLDLKNSRQVMAILKKLSKDHLVLVVSHDFKLVKDYSNKIIHLKNGSCNYHWSGVKKEEYHIKIKRKYLLLAIYQLRINVRRKVKLLLALVISFYSILFIFNLAFSLEKQVRLQLGAIFPINTVSFIEKKTQVITQRDLKDVKKYFSYIYLEPKEYELLGCSRDSQTKNIFINDSTKMMQGEKLIWGRLPKNEDEVVINEKLYQELAVKKIRQDFNIYLNFQYQRINKKYPIKVVGVIKADQLTTNIYFKEYANIKWLHKLFGEKEIIAGVAVGVLKDQNLYQVIRRKHPNLKIRLVNRELNQRINYLIFRLKLILVVFSSLALMASFFLLGEILYLEVIYQRRDIGIMTCLGADKRLIGISFYIELLILVSLSYLISCFLVQESNYWLNYLLVNDFKVELKEVMQIDYIIVGGLYILVVIISFLIGLIPLRKIQRVDPIKAVKGLD